MKRKAYDRALFLFGFSVLGGALTMGAGWLTPGGGWPRAGALVVALALCAGWAAIVGRRMR